MCYTDWLNDPLHAVTENSCILRVSPRVVALLFPTALEPLHLGWVVAVSHHELHPRPSELTGLERDIPRQCTASSPSSQSNSQSTLHSRLPG